MGQRHALTLCKQQVTVTIAQRHTFKMIAKHTTAATRANEVMTNAGAKQPTIQPM
jgi:hypothetical protein